MCIHVFSLVRAWVHQCALTRKFACVFLRPHTGIDLDFYRFIPALLCITCSKTTESAIAKSTPPVHRFDNMVIIASRANIYIFVFFLRSSLPENREHFNRQGTGDFHIVSCINDWWQAVTDGALSANQVLPFPSLRSCVRGRHCVQEVLIEEHRKIVYHCKCVR